MNARPLIASLLGIASLLALSIVGRAAEEHPVRVTCVLPDGPKTLAQCRDIRSARMKLRGLKNQGKLSGPIEVVLEKGVYAISETTSFTT